MIKRFDSHKQASAYVIIDGNTISLVSYTTVVAVISDNILTVNGLYSATTRKHISWFMREYASPWTFQTAKSLALNGDAMNICTGEIVSR